jgi:hypothetical protein
MPRGQRSGRKDDPNACSGPRNEPGEPRLSSASAVISLGLVLGSWASGMSGWFLWFTRPYRKARNLLVIGLGYIVVGGSAIGSLWLLREASERMGFGRDAQGYAARYAWTVSFTCGSLLVLRSEIKWRRSVGLSDKKVVPPPNGEH